MPKKDKKPAPPHLLISSEQGLEAALNRYVLVSLDLVRKRAKQEKAIAALKAEHDKENGELETEFLALETSIQLFCTTHRATILPDEEKSKSREYGNATIGFRLNPTACAKIVEKDTWPAIAKRLDATEWGEQFVKTKLDVDKEAMLTHRADLTDAQLAEAGVTFSQGETFFIEPKSDLLEAARKPVDAEEQQEVA